MQYISDIWLTGKALKTIQKLYVNLAKESEFEQGLMKISCLAPGF